MKKKLSAVKAISAKRKNRKRPHKSIVKPRPYFTWWRFLFISALAFCIGAAVAMYKDYRQSRVETQLSKIGGQPKVSEETDLDIKIQAQTDQEYLDKLIDEAKDDFYEEDDFLQPAVPMPAIPALPPVPAIPSELARPAAVPVTVPQLPAATNKIVIIIDDVGLNIKRTNELIGLHKSITLSYLTYAPHLVRQLENAVSRGREVMVHVPMQAWRVPLTAGVLHDSMTPRQMDHLMDEYLAKCLKVKGCVGMNNHMGSRLTGNSYFMQRIMQKLRGKNLVFVDSRTSNSSMAYDTAVLNNVPALRRDVFIDHDEGVPNALRQLDRLLEISTKKGIAIAIGHPKPDTITAIRRWIADLPDGFEIITVSQAAKQQ